MARQGEANVQKRVMLAVSRIGCRIFRNVIGFDRERRVTYGLGKGSSDLVGWFPVEITSQHVGTTVAVFTAIEVKGEKTVLKDHQVNFLQRVIDDGGIGIVARGNTDDVIRILGEISKGRKEARGYLCRALSAAQKRKRKAPKPKNP